MLREAVSYLLTPCSPAARSLGYLYEALALQARAARCAAHWSGHIANCHEAIREAMAACPGRTSALVCGSGLLLEAPMQALLAGFSRVDCLDIVHLRGVKKRYPQRTVFIEADLTGVAGPIAAARGKTPFDPGSPPPVPALGDEYDLVVSCNLASQLAVLPVRALCKRGLYSQEQLDGFARALVLTHLRWLAALPGVVCLITDTVRQRQSPGGETETEDALWGVGLKNTTRQWWWDIAPAPELGRNLSQRNRMCAVAVFTQENMSDGAGT
ncbi:MAG: hypothetical protein HQK81_00920 [Desulfovibrionaceae bacterium]|nr:hypothetical protein [Desulfovibrionaceae bacterium]MBF0512609.1 hypothetical protein [Desulfovibrionaceae bacterium]